VPLSKAGFQQNTALTLLWRTAGMQAGTAARRSATVFPSAHLQEPLLTASPKAWTLLCADGDGTEQEAGELLHPSPTSDRRKLQEPEK